MSTPTPPSNQPPHNPPLQNAQPGPEQPYGGPVHPGQPGVAYAPAPPPKKRRVWLWVLLGILAVILIFIVGCSALVAKSVGDAVQSAAPQQPNTVPSGGSSDPGASPSAAGSDTTAKFGDTVRYADGLQISVTKTKNKKQSKYTEHPGEPMTVLYVKVTNGTDQNLNADLVTVDVTYGKDGNGADQVFDTGVGGQVSGTLAKGKSKTGEYAFAVPSKERGDVSAEISLVDLDHEDALFTGSVK